MYFADDNISSLTNRQLEILEYLTKGHTNIEISNILKVSANTIKAHIAHIYEKLDVTNRTEAAVRYNKIQAGSPCNVKPIMILELFSYYEAELADATNKEENYHLALLLQTKLLTLLSNRKIVSIVKANASTPQLVGCLLGYFVSGTIERQSDGINITVHLENHPQRIHIWSHTFYEKGENLDLVINWSANKVVASLMYHLISKEASTLMELQQKEKSFFQNILLGFHQISLATSESIMTAKEIFDSIITDHPSNISVLYGQCIVAYHSIIKHISHNSAADYLLLKNCSMSIANISKQCSQNWFSQGLLSLLDQDIKTAIFLFNNALYLDPSLQEVYFVLAQLYTLTGDYQNGKKYLGQGASLCLDYQYKENHLVSPSLIYFGLGQYDNAVEIFEYGI